MASIGNRTAAEKAKGGITRRSIKKGEVIPPKLHEDFFNGKYWRLNKGAQPVLLTEAGTAFATAADNQADMAILQGGSVLWYTQLGAATILGPQLDATGLKVSLDDTAAEGAQYVPGGPLGALSMTVERTAGQIPDKGRFIRARFKLEDVSGAGSLAFGFRKYEAVQDDPQNYDEGAFFQVIVGDVNTVVILNGTPTVLDSTQNWADGETHELEVRVGGSGIVKFLFDGEDLVVGPPQFQFDDNEVIIPFFDYANEAGSTSDCHLTDLVVSTLDHVE